MWRVAGPRFVTLVSSDLPTGEHVELDVSDLRQLRGEVAGYSVPVGADLSIGLLFCCSPREDAFFEADPSNRLVIPSDVHPKFTLHISADCRGFARARLQCVEITAWQAGYVSGAVLRLAAFSKVKTPGLVGG